jgi:predicted ester cyclase
MDQKETIEFGLEQLVKGNLDIIDEIFSTNYLAHAGDKEYIGHAFLKKFTRQLRSAIPDIHIVKIEFLAKAGDTITWQRTFSGTHMANMRGIPPSGKKVKWIEMIVTRFQDKKIAEEWVVSELAGELALKQPANKKKPQSKLEN